MTENIQCSLAGLGRMTAFRAQGQRGINGIAGSRASRGRPHHMLGEDDDAVGPGTARVDSVMGSGTAPGAQHHGLGEDNVVAGSGMVSRAWGWRLRGRWCHRLGSRKMAARRGAQPWLGMTAWRLWGGLDEGEEAPARTR
jgi:hypothetical protein